MLYRLEDIKDLDEKENDQRKPRQEISKKAIWIAAFKYSWKDMDSAIGSTEHSFRQRPMHQWWLVWRIVATALVTSTKLNKLRWVRLVLGLVTTFRGSTIPVSIQATRLSIPMWVGAMSTVKCQWKKRRILRSSTLRVRAGLLVFWLKSVKGAAGCYFELAIRPTSVVWLRNWV